MNTLPSKITDLIIIDEAHEGIRNYQNRVHKTCLEIQERDKKTGKKRHFLLLNATPWNNRREDIYNILVPFLTRSQGFKDLGFPAELVQWFQNRDIGVEQFTDNSELFRSTYKEIFLQRTRQMLRDATPDLNLYAKRVAEWLPVNFEPTTEQALDQIFTQFESSLYIPFADPIRYLRGNVEQRSLLANQRRFFLQRAESSMYALQRTIKCFGDRIRELQQRLEAVSPDADGLKEFLLIHYKFESEHKANKLTSFISSYFNQGMTVVSHYSLVSPCSSYLAPVAITPFFVGWALSIRVAILIFALSFCAHPTFVENGARCQAPFIPHSRSRVGFLAERK